MKHPSFFLPATLAAVLLAIFAPAVRAQSTATFTTLHDFGAFNSSGENSDGGRPVAGVIKGQDGNFYGTTDDGGTKGGGTVFQMTPAGVVTLLHDFGSSGDYGNHPQGGLVQASDGTFYGACRTGGSKGDGTIYSITTDGTLTTLFSFGDKSGYGLNPKDALIVGSDGNLYGTTFGGGPNDGGTVFQMTPAGVLTTVYGFSDSGGDGEAPRGGVILAADGNFYGTTEEGGTGGDGTVFKLTPAGDITILHSFSGGSGDGSLPYEGVVAGTDGNFYGTTEAGGTNGDGTVYKITPAGNLTILYDFDSADGNGAAPFATLTLGSDGDFYGTTTAGGTNGTGTVFQITPTGTLTTLHGFSAVDANGYNGDGDQPNGDLLEVSPGVFYGTTNVGGEGAEGTVYKIGVSPTITSALKVSTTVGQPFSYTIKATFAPTSYGATGLPSGLSVNKTTGVISGTPASTAVGNKSITLKATNAAGTTTEILALTISPAAAPVITSAKTASAVTGKAFIYAIKASNDPASFGATGLPSGLSVNASTGVISGTPASTATGVKTITLKATNATGTGTATLTLTIVTVPKITSAATASATTGKAFSYQITATNSPTSYAATGLPSGLSVNKTTGLISGTPASTASGTKTIDLSASNAAGTGTATLTLTISKG